MKHMTTFAVLLSSLFSIFAKAEDVAFSQLLSAKTKQEFSRKLEKWQATKSSIVACSWEMKLKQPPCHCYHADKVDVARLDQLCIATTQHQTDLALLQSVYSKCAVSKNCQRQISKQIELLEYQVEAKDLPRPKFFGSR